MILVPNAKKDGLGASFADASSQKVVCGALGLWILGSLLCMSGMLDILGMKSVAGYMMKTTSEAQGIMVLVIMVVLIIFLAVILSTFRKKFGGITGVCVCVCVWT